MYSIFCRQDTRFQHIFPLFFLFNTVLSNMLLVLGHAFLICEIDFRKKAQMFEHASFCLFDYVPDFHFVSFVSCN